MEFSKIKSREEFLQRLLQTRLAEIRKNYESLEKQKHTQEATAHLQGQAEAYREIYDILIGEIEIGIPVDD